jgi:cobalt-zinc-cadmium efflux system outer membrane protein
MTSLRSYFRVPRSRASPYYISSFALLFIVLLDPSSTCRAQQLVVEALPPTIATPAASETWTLLEVEAWAEQNSPVLRQAAAEIRVQRGRAHQAWLLPNPEFQGGSPQLGGRDSQYFAMLTQEIVTKHKLQLDRAAICQEVLQAELHFLRARFDLLTSVRQSFFTLLVAQQRFVALERLMEIVRRSQQAAQKLEVSGQGSRSDTLLFELEVERAEFASQNAAVYVDAAKRQLAATLGDPNLVIDSLEGNLAAPIADYPFQLTQAGVLSRNALVQVAQSEIERSEILLRRAVVQPFPNITVGGGYMHQVTDPNKMAMFQVSLPLPLWNKNQGAINAAEANVVRAGHAARKIELDLVRQLAAATGRFEAAQQQVTKFEKSILPKANESVRLTQQAFEQGQFDLMRVLQSQRVLIESELNYLTAQEARWTSAAEISGLLQQESFADH